MENHAKSAVWGICSKQEKSGSKVGMTMMEENTRKNNERQRNIISNFRSQKNPLLVFAKK